MVNPHKSRFFIALLPPQMIQDAVKEIQQYFADHHDSRGAQKSPPHITLQPPFEWGLAETNRLRASLEEFARSQPSVPVTLSGFGAFVPRVIYVNVLKTPELLNLQQALMASMETTCGIVDRRSQDRPFAPHMTVAFRDLSRQQFRAAWPEFQNRPISFEFTATHLTLLLHDGKRWNVETEFPFQT